MKNKIKKIIVMVCTAIICSFILNKSINMIAQTKKEEIKYSEFEKEMENVKIMDSEMYLSNAIIEIEGIYEKEGSKIKFDVLIPKTDETIIKLEKLLTKDGGKIELKTKSDLIWILLQYIPTFAIIIVFLKFMNRDKGMISEPSEIVNSSYSFSNVAGCEEEKEEIQEIVDYLKAPEKYTEMGARIPKGILMSGPPGTGKTLLAKAAAGEAGVPFFYASGSDFMEMFVGVGPGRVRSLFKNAKKKAPCIIFIDEIDAIGGSRATNNNSDSERERTLNQILVEMDGMNSNEGVVIIAATNRPDILDAALLRSGRFDRRITVSLPDVKGREEILKIYTDGKKIDPEINIKGVAQRTPGFSGADLENVVNEAAILAVRNKQESITEENFEEAIDRVIMGPAKKSKKYTDEDKKRVAYHEAGHAVVGLLYPYADKVKKITIIPRGDAGGYNFMLPEDKMFPTYLSLKARIVGLLGGLMAEKIKFGELNFSTGASNDIEKLTEIARQMVKIYGMSSLGPVQYKTNQETIQNGYSQKKLEEIDNEVDKIIRESEKECKKIIVENISLLKRISEKLYEKEVLVEEDINKIMEEWKRDNIK